MAGNVKVGGNVIATHTGVEGAGTVTLSNVTASGIKMSSSGNTITDSAGNAVISESGGNVTLGNVRLPASGGIKNSSGNNVLSEAGGIVSLQNVVGTTKLDGTLAFFGGSTAGNRSFTLDGVSKYHVFAWVRYDADPYYPMVLSFVIDSSDGTITKKTDDWGTSVNESYNTSTKVLEIISQGGTLMQVQIFYGDIIEGATS